MESVSEIPSKKKRGRFFYGCLAFSFLSILGIGFATSGLWFAYKKIAPLFFEVTEDKPLAFPPELISESELQAVHTRIHRFLDDSEKSIPTPPLVLSAAEVNSLIQTDERLNILKDRLRIELYNGQIHALVSMPLDMLNRPDRYLNGSAILTLDHNKKGPQLYLEHFEVHGKTMPEELMKQLRTVDLVQEAGRKSENRDFIELLDRIQIQNNQIVLFGKSSTSL